jgi:DNA-binding CsgD family transcriptional regulator/tetratricopeptide (TPR) repeat protein
MLSPALLERDLYLARLNDLLREAAQGSGRCVLIGGEAGIGKSALLEAFAASDRSDRSDRTTARFLWGQCEALYTPRPLGPLYDIAPLLDGMLSVLMDHKATRATIFSTLLSALRAGPAPTVVIIEDVHWADEATLDMVKFLARRVHQSSTLLIVTYRDDEIGPDHPLWFVFGDMPSKATARIYLPPLSEQAVAQLAVAAQHSVSHLYAITGGNPFFVTEVLASGDRDTGIPETVRAAVLARASRLSAAGRALLELVAVVPARAESWLIEAILGPSSVTVDARIDECVLTGVLHLERDGIAFRHELARQAIVSAIPQQRLKELHGRVLRALLDRGLESSQIARLVHHATGAEERAVVLQFAPEAARQASAHGAHREAAIHYQSALTYAAPAASTSDMAPSQRAELLAGLSYECYLTNQFEEARRARAEALTLWQDLGDREKVGQSQRWLSRLNWFLGNKSAADHYGRAAVATLQDLPDGRELALAYSNLAQLSMLEDDVTGTHAWGSKALELAGALHDDEVMCHALNNIGTAELMAGQEEGHLRLTESLRIALAHGFEEHAARAYTNLASRAVAGRVYPEAMRYLDRGIAYCADRDLDSWGLYMTGWRARAYLELGEWAAAADDANRVLVIPRASPVVRISALAALATVRLRRSDPGSGALLDEALALAQQTGELQRIAPVAAARAEKAWLSDDLTMCLAEARRGFEHPSTHPGTHPGNRGNPFEFGQLCFWMWQAGGLSEPPDDVVEPYAAQFAGEWQRAAALWARLGCPYEQALALSAGDRAARKEALNILQALGARATLGRLTRQRQAEGIQPVLRGPRAATRSNPANMTDRQLEVLRLMAQGCSNVEIAASLSASPKTVEHHVSSIFAKLGVRSRTQAIAAAHNLGAIPKPR